MDMATFAANVRGFAKETIVYPDETEERVFCIGRLGAIGFLVNLRKFVAECERLRALARSKSDAHLSQSAQPLFSPENDRDGFGYRSREALYKIHREHGRVVNALENAIGPSAENGTASFMRPDLYINDRNGNMSILFEVKISPDTQSWLTAIGQLIVYGAHQTKSPLRVLVCHAERADYNFKQAINLLGIRILIYERDDDSYVFPDLSSILAR